MDSEGIVMQTPRRGTRAKPTGFPQIGIAFDNAGGKLGRARRTFFEVRDASREVVRHPMPKATSGRRIRVVNSDRVTLGAFRRTTPFQSWRDVAACTAELIPVVLLRDGAVWGDAWAAHHKLSGRHNLSIPPRFPFWFS